MVQCHQAIDNGDFPAMLVSGIPRRRSVVDVENANSATPLLGDECANQTNLLQDFRTILWNTYINVLQVFVSFAVLSDLFEWLPILDLDEGANVNGTIC